MATTEERLGAIEKKLDLLLENQKQQVIRYENYSGFFRKKINDTAESLTNAVTAQTVLVSDAVARIEKALAPEPAQGSAPADPKHAELLRLLSELSTP